MKDGASLRVIATLRNGFREKFGVPRQSGLVPEAVSRVVMEEEYRDPAAFRGIEMYSHLWLIWGFHQVERTGWRPTVRPPRLGGNTRLGVFATRSPYRPNPIGLTVVKLLHIEVTSKGAELIVSGADMVDGTPIYDIKPYLPYVDSLPEASGGFTEETKGHRLTVTFPPELLARLPAEDRDAVLGILGQDPRPGYQKDPERIYGVPYGDWDIRFTVDGNNLTVVDTVPYQEHAKDLLK